MLIFCSYCNFKNQWVYIYHILQPVTLATILSAIAAYGVISQFNFKPYVFSTINLKDTRLITPSADVYGIVLTSNNVYDIDLKICNCSSISVNNIVVQAVIPSPIKVKSIDCSSWHKIDNDNHQIEVQFKDYNLHPLMLTIIKMKIEIDKSGDTIVPLTFYTSAKDQIFIGNTDFIIIPPKTVKDLKGKDIKEKIRKGQYPIANLRERYALAQVLLLISILLLSLASWLHYI